MLDSNLLGEAEFLCRQLQNNGSEIKGLVVCLAAVADIMSQMIFTMREQAIRTRVIAKEADNNFRKMKKILDELTVRLTRSPSTDQDSLDENSRCEVDTAQATRKVSSPFSTFENPPSVADFQSVKASLDELQVLLETWLSAYDHGFPSTETGQELLLSSGTDHIILGESIYPKRVLTRVKQALWSLYRLVPSTLKSLVYTNINVRKAKREPRRNLEEENELLDLKYLGLDTEEDFMTGLFGRDLLDDRAMVDGIESFTQLVESYESKAQKGEMLDGIVQIFTD